jgi:hypothetical protein
MNDSNIDTNKTYTFVFSSALGQLANPATNNIVTYNIDWGVMPDQPYWIYFTYLGEVNTIDALTLPMVYMDILQSSNVYETMTLSLGGFSRTAAVKTNYLGTLKYKSVGVNSFLYSDKDTNPPIYMATRPMNNQPRIEIVNNNNPQTPYVPSANDLGQYVLTLTFIPANSKKYI